jgi:hypothetical protein
LQFRELQGVRRRIFWGHIFPLGCSSSPQNFVTWLQVVWEIHRSKVWGWAMLIHTWWTVREVTADRPRGAWQPSCYSCSSRVLERLSFDLFCQLVFGARSLWTVCTRVSDGPWRGGLSVGPSQMVCFCRCTTGGLGSNFGQSTPTLRRSAPSSRTIRPDSADGPHGALQTA